MAYDLKALEDSLISFQNEDLDRARRKVFILLFILSIYSERYHDLDNDFLNDGCTAYFYWIAFK